MTSEEIRLDIKVVNGLRIAYDSDKYKSLKFVCTNPYTGHSYSGIVEPKKEFHVDIHYLCPWKIQIFHEEVNLADFEINYKDSEVGFRFASTALGDTLAWVPVLQAWIEKNEPSKVYLHTTWNHLFDKSKYPKITWLDNADQFKNVPPLRLFHTVGISRDHIKSINSELNHATPTNWKETNMIDTQNYAFGVEPIQRKPELIQLPPERMVKDKYVTMCNESSQKIKHLLKPKVWLALIEELKRKGYEVVTVGNKSNIFSGVIQGNAGEIQKAMILIRDAEFHIGLSSGLSWVAWAYNKQVLMLGNFTDMGYEFNTNLLRVIDKSGTWGIFNDSAVPWIPEYGYDPEEDNVQLARRISTEHALKGLDILIQRMEQNPNGFPGIFVTEDYKVHDIVTLRPKEIPKT